MTFRYSLAVYRRRLDPERGNGESKKRWFSVLDIRQKKRFFTFSLFFVISIVDKNGSIAVL
ncbi:hypothetical protein AU254_09085 [Yersinia pestis]|nr:hypothetical protein AU254_09085 [Yersinia pestis]